MELAGYADSRDASPNVEQGICVRNLRAKVGKF
jgi:hypothetical protein